MFSNYSPRRRVTRGSIAGFAEPRSNATAWVGRATGASGVPRVLPTRGCRHLFLAPRLPNGKKLSQFKILHRTHQVECRVSS